MNEVISPLEGEMPGRPEGGAVPPTCHEAARSWRFWSSSRFFTPPSGLPAISPARGEIGSSGAGFTPPAG
ncbi:hypothetical protein FJ934_21520 [Mesorhizobium sp. B2-4-12]|nr:hypothetical protein FJ934_21520 [Mesorhizobium sp. B2-4-12]